MQKLAKSTNTRMPCVKCNPWNGLNLIAHGSFYCVCTHFEEKNLGTSHLQFQDLHQPTQHEP